VVLLSDSTSALRAAVCGSSVGQYECSKSCGMWFFCRTVPSSLRAAVCGSSVGQYEFSKSCGMWFFCRTVRVL
jgi:ABC-type arginine transport system permease subunit